MDTLKGKFCANRKGFGFVTPENDTEDKLEDIMIPPSLVNGALNGDTVLIRIVAKPKFKRMEGEVLKILERGVKTVVGVFKAKHNGGVVYPNDDNFAVNIFIPFKFSLQAKTGQMVVAEITSYPKKFNMPEGKIKEILGGMWEPGIELKCIARSHGFYEKFPQEVLQEANKVSFIKPIDLDGREDFRNKPIISIDGEDAKDLDDAVSLEKSDDGMFILGVHVADVSHYVRDESALDKEALKRATSVYFPGCVIPMLPTQLSNGICSLNEGCERLTLSVIMKIDEKGKVCDSKIVPSVIINKHRMTYNEVTAILNQDEVLIEKYSDVYGMIKDMLSLSRILLKNRKARGSIELDIPETKFELDNNGKVINISPYLRTLSTQIIEEFMLLANETVAETFAYADIPFIYRVHTNPEEAKAEKFFSFARGLGLKVNKQNFDTNSYVSILKQVENTDVEPVMNRIMLRSMQKAEYRAENIGHFGLASKFYCHFTSPIRRYPDLAIHRIIKKYLHGELNSLNMDKLKEFTVNAASQSSKMERAADLAEREADDLKKAEYMANKIGEVYEGIVSGVTYFGIFVELKNTAEGLIRTEDLPGCDYEFLPDKYILRNDFQTYTLGQKLNVAVAGVDDKKGKINFVLADDSCRLNDIKKDKNIKRKGKKLKL